MFLLKLEFVQVNLVMNSLSVAGSIRVSLPHVLPITGDADKEVGSVALRTLTSLTALLKNAKSFNMSCVNTQGCTNSSKREGMPGVLEEKKQVFV